MSEPKRLLRSRRNRVFAGVCGGIAEYANLDPVIVRILWVVGSILLGVVGGIIVYVVAWLIVPEAPVLAGIETKPPQA